MNSKAEYYKEESEVLFSEWKERHKKAGYTTFIQDGIVDPKQWFSQQVRVLFLLKEAYPDDKAPKGVSNIAENLITPNENKGRIWSAVAEWQYGIEHTTKNNIPSFNNWIDVQEKADWSDRNRRCDLLRKCAIINIKKSNGQNGSDDRDLERYVEEDGDLLRRQIEIIDPTIIVCGNTFHLLQDKANSPTEHRMCILGEDTSSLPNDRGCYKVGNRLVISYYHPANHYPAALNYYGIVCMLHNYLKEVCL